MVLFASGAGHYEISDSVRAEEAVHVFGFGNQVIVLVQKDL